MEMTISFPGGKRVDAEFNGFKVQTDQEGAAPPPFDYFLASLGTCAGIYALSFCRSRGIPTEGLKLIQHSTHDKETKRLTKVAIEIQVPPGFPEKYLGAIRAAAENCAVKRALANPPELEVSSKAAS